MPQMAYQTLKSAEILNLLLSIFYLLGWNISKRNYRQGLGLMDRLPDAMKRRNIEVIKAARLSLDVLAKMGTLYAGKTLLGEQAHHLIDIITQEF